MIETDIQKDICRYLETKNVLFWRQNNAPVYDSSRGVFRKRGKWQAVGLSDIVVILPQISLFLEVKTPKGRQSKDQRVFEKAVMSSGACLYIIVSSVEDVQTIFRSVGDEYLKDSQYKAGVKQYKDYMARKEAGLV
jgi:hypothetical protein